CGIARLKTPFTLAKDKGLQGFATGESGQRNPADTRGCGPPYCPGSPDLMPSRFILRHRVVEETPRDSATPARSLGFLSSEARMARRSASSTTSARLGPCCAASGV